MKLFKENGQVIAVIISLIVVAVLVSGQIGSLGERLTAHADGVEERLTARIDRVEDRIGRVEAQIGRLEDRVHSIEVFLREDGSGGGE